VSSRPRRLTRAESQERTRATLVAVATELFVRDGFKATTLEHIGQEAGYTRGAVYSNFAGKTEMGIAVIDELYAQAEGRLADALRQDDWLTAITAWAEATVGDPAWMRLELEIAASSAGDPAYQGATAARYTRLREHGRELLSERFGDAADVDETLAIALLGMLLGVGAQRAADPSIPATAWSDAVRRLLGSAARV
jgi:AcrR family transcriptional regulator